MHIPDGFLSTTTWVSAWTVSAGGLGCCLRQAGREMKDRMVPLMGVLSAFIFAAQMINFPVMGGTSGHLLGGVLAAVLLGPWAGAVVIACVLIFQCLVFQDGGLTALGANILNMALAGTLGGYLVYRVMKKLLGGRKGIVTAAVAAAWISVVAAASLCAAELALSGTSPLGLVLPAMVAVHAVIGIGEGMITGLIVGFILKTRPDLIYGVQGTGVRVQGEEQEYGKAEGGLDAKA
ncbi:MAG TPA: energy-coupling factor ABC transporter permease [Syntrophales bacterium]|nr:energy-coupling factor ABC transporter permease [Syntrophales bacterium]